MKKLHLFIIAISLSVSTFSQLQLGIRGGVSSSSIKVSDAIELANGEEISIDNYNPLLGFHFGVVTRAQLFNVYLQPELLFSSTGGEVHYIELTNEDVVVTDEIRTLKYNKIDIPVLAGMKFGPARIQVGPVASFVINEKNELFDNPEYKQELNKATFGYQVGVGLDLFKLLVDLKYEGNLSRLGKGVTIDNRVYNFDTRNSQFIFSIGYFF